MGKYDDILHAPRPKSERHAPMSLIDRGAQFSPFAALVGYEGVIAETARLTEAVTEPDESVKEVLDRALRRIAENPEGAGEVDFFCFRPDARKAGGQYVHILGRVKKIDTYQNVILLQDGRTFPIDSIRSIDGMEEMQ